LAADDTDARWPKPHRLDEPIAISLADLVPWNHSCCNLEALDALGSGLYEPCGRSARRVALR
jgi:hypothetical protein